LCFPVPFDFISKKVKQIEVFQDHYDKRFYLAVTFDEEEPPFIDNGLYQAFDLGTTKHTAINLQGKVIESTVKRPDKYWEPKIQILQRRRDHCKRGSRRHRVFGQRLATIQRKCRHQTWDWQHKQSLNLLRNTKANTLILGDLSPKQMTAGRKNGNLRRKQKRYLRSVNRGVYNTGHLGRFIELLTYKAKRLGKRVTVIDERDTTKTCAGCGHKKERVPLSDRIYQCEICGIVRDRDHNAVINIMKRFLSQHALWTGYQVFMGQLDNLRYTVNGKTKVPYHHVGDGFRELVGSPLR
jgi:putative transposase